MVGWLSGRTSGL